MDVGQRSKMTVRRVLAVLSARTSDPYGTHLLLDAKKVIKAIESFRVTGRTMLAYFISVIRVLREMSFVGVPDAGKARMALQRYKDINYQHFALKRTEGPARNRSQVRARIVEENREVFQQKLAKVSVEKRFEIAGVLVQQKDNTVVVMCFLQLKEEWLRCRGP